MNKIVLNTINAQVIQQSLQNFVLKMSVKLFFEKKDNKGSIRSAVLVLFSRRRGFMGKTLKDFF